MTARSLNASRARFMLGALLALTVLAMALVAAFWTPVPPNKMDMLHRMQPPTFAFPFGTDEFGRDVLSRIMSGAWSSVSVGFMVVAFATIIGTIIGLATGFYRGWTDRVTMVFNDALMAFPGILLALGLVSVFGASKSGIVVALGIAFVPTVLRVTRATAMSLRQREFIEASRALGNGSVYTLVRHILPNAIGPIAVLATTMFGWAILLESALSFLGLGVPPPAATWGNMLAGGRPYLGTAPWLSIIPGCFIAITLLAANMLGDTLRDWLDPRN